VASGGAYRIQSSSLNKEFEAPQTTAWAEQEISIGLNGIPVNSGYKLHTWNFANLEGCDYEDLATLFESQQDDNAQLSQLETDPYDASGAAIKYGTVTFTDFIIRNIAPRTRGLPFYDNVTVIFEVFVS
jgi:hypothetical protein